MEESMGTKYVETVRLNFEKLYEDSDPSTPVFFILSPGVDPLRDVEKLGNTVHIFVLNSTHPVLFGLNISKFHLH